MLRRRSSRRRADPRAPDRRTRKDWLRGAPEDAMDMDEADAEAIASQVMDVFDGSDEVDDETLNPQVRSIFYTLEAKRILTFRRIEYKDEDGRTLRGFYWRLNPQFEIADRESEGERGTVYESLPSTAWQREQTA